jgi:hypothetical protein
MKDTNNKYSIYNWDFSVTETSSLKQLNEWVRAKPLHEYIVPEKYIPKPKVYNDTNANSLTESIEAFFNVVGGFANRINTTGRMIKDGKGQWITVPGVTMKGTADIQGAVEGITYHVEVKHGNDRVSEDQREFEKMVKAAGQHYIIARDFDGFIFLLKRSLEKEGVWRM